MTSFIGFATVTRLGASTTEVAIVRDGAVHFIDEVHVPAPGMATSVDDMLPEWPAWSQWLARFHASAIAAPDRRAQVRFCPPLLRSPTLYCAGGNYQEHLQGVISGAPVPKKPYHFVSPAQRMIGHDRGIRRPPGCSQLDWEVELAIIIGRRAECVTEDAALRYVAGYAVANDISARDLFVRDDVPFRLDFMRGKGHGGTLPIGPVVVPASSIENPQSLAIRLSVNRQVMQDSSTAKMIFSCARQISELSHMTPLLPGDVIITGTPAGVGMERNIYLKDGDQLVCEIERVGTLSNFVEVAGAAPAMRA